MCMQGKSEQTGGLGACPLEKLFTMVFFRKSYNHSQYNTLLENKSVALIVQHTALANCED